jgi:hypothetical protein
MAPKFQKGPDLKRFMVRVNMSVREGELDDGESKQSQSLVRIFSLILGYQQRLHEPDAYVYNR